MAIWTSLKYLFLRPFFNIQTYSQCKELFLSGHSTSKHNKQLKVILVKLDFLLLSPLSVRLICAIHNCIFETGRLLYNMDKKRHKTHLINVSASSHACNLASSYVWNLEICMEQESEGECLCSWVVNGDVEVEFLLSQDEAVG